MTVDDDNSIYVGGLPYTATEDALRRVFDPYGAIIAVKIVNDHTTKGKCYGFVTFRNPRSVIDAINEMNGKTIDGRAVRVNEVTTRGGKSNYSRERYRHNQVRGMDSSRGRNQERDYDRERYRYREQYSDRSRERNRSWDNVEGIERQYELSERQYELTQNQERTRHIFLDGERDEGKNTDWNSEVGRDIQQDQDWEMNGTNGGHRNFHNKIDQQAKNQNISGHNDQDSREHSSDSSGDYHVAVKEKLEKSVQRCSELKKEISEMERRLADKQNVVWSLQKKTLILEDALVTAKKRSSQHKMCLTKLQKGYLQVKEYSERIKSCEEEFQWLVNSAVMDSDLANDNGDTDRILNNGKV